MEATLPTRKTESLEWQAPASYRERIGPTMQHEFDEGLKAHINRDEDGVVRNVLHIEEPFLSRARTPQLAAQEYLEKFRTALGIDLD